MSALPHACSLSELKQDITCLHVTRLRRQVISAYRNGNDEELINALHTLSQNHFKERWGLLRRALFDALRIPELRCIDRDPISMLASALETAKSDLLSHVEKIAIESLRKQVDQGNTFFINLEKLRETQAAMLIPEIVSTRMERLRQICKQHFDLRQFVQSYYGFQLVASEVRDRNFGKRLIHALEELDIAVSVDVCAIDFDVDFMRLSFDAVSTRTRKLLCEILRLTGNNSGERAEAAKSLGAIGDPRAEPYLRPATEDKYPWVKKAAIDALGKIRLSSSICVLVERLYDLESSVREKAASNIVSFGKKTIPHLLDVLEDDREIHFEPALEEAEAAHPRSLDSFAAALLHRDSEAKRHAMELLNKLGYFSPQNAGSGKPGTTMGYSDPHPGPID